MEISDETDAEVSDKPTTSQEKADPMLQRYLDLVMKDKSSKTSIDVPPSLANDLKLFEATGRRPERLKSLYSRVH